MEIKPAHSQDACSRMTTAELRRAFLVDTLFVPGELKLVYWETDRAILGSAVPLAAPILLTASTHMLGADFFLQRRELGVINLGGPGFVDVDGTRKTLARLETIYVGRGIRSVVFHSADASTPARFFLVSYPAHADHPVALIGGDAENVLNLGTPERANVRRLHQQIREGGPASCQLVMGYTELSPGSVWNTFPPHTHLRRSEIYLYFDLPPEQAVVHLMGPPDETRHLVVREGQAILSPAWSIHSGCGTSAYRFVWAMGGENQRFDDMDPAPVGKLL
jgi:4-deoxy-L-threo-5-hexosulose-uronate ketol-isomerase